MNLFLEDSYAVETFKILCSLSFREGTPPDSRGGGIEQLIRQISERIEEEE